MVKSFMVDFDMNEDAVIEAIEELNVRGIYHRKLDLSQQRLGAEGEADGGKVFDFLSKLVSAAQVHDVATVELQLSNLRIYGHSPSILIRSQKTPTSKQCCLG